MSSSSRDCKRPAGQVCIGEAFSKLAKYERDRGKWKMLTRNVATYAAIPIPPRACAADEELTRPLARWRNSEQCLNRTPRRNTTGWVCLQDIWTLCQCILNRTRQFTEGFVVLDRASDVDSITDYNGLLPRAWDRLGHRVHLTFFFKATFLFNCICLFDIYFIVLQAECSLT